MSLYFGDKKIGNIGITNGIGLDTSDANITPVDMQNGKTAYVNGKKITGTGKCFEFARYGREVFDLITDENGNSVYGFVIENASEGNTIFISSLTNSDIVIQDIFRILNIEENIAVRIGTNCSTNNDIFIYRNQDDLYIYTNEISNDITTINLFIGKDNNI